jgi:hypothetical protein
MYHVLQTIRSDNDTVTLMYIAYAQINQEFI